PVIALLLCSLAAACTEPSHTPETPAANATIEALNEQLARLQTTPTVQAAAPTPIHEVTPIPPSASTPMPSPTTATVAVEDAVNAIKRYTAYLWSDRNSGSAISLGNGKLLTNYHVVQGLTTINGRFADGRQDPLRVLRTDSRRDLALLGTSFADL